MNEHEKRQLAKEASILGELGPEIVANFPKTPAKPKTYTFSTTTKKYSERAVQHLLYCEASFSWRTVFKKDITWYEIKCKILTKDLAFAIWEKLNEKAGEISNPHPFSLSYK